MLLRRATLSDLSLLRRWNRNAHVVAATGGGDCWDWDEMLRCDPDWQEILIAETGGRPVGMMQIIDPAREEDHYWGDVEENLRAIDIWLGEPADLGRGLGTQMMRLALERCFADPTVRAVVVDPLADNVRVHTFYRRLGFREVGRRTFGTDDCLVLRLERADWDAPSPPLG